jgi:Asp-tRNA(Asn)/Glu-tRNA(Gln) amidotransferase C subunit
LYGLENELMLEEQQIIENRVAFSRQIESELKNNFKLQFNDMMQYFKIVSKIKTERQAYLTQMLNNKYNRSISVYTLIIANAKKWKANYVSRLKILKK